ncbi:PIN domain-containing protein [Sorangium sp. So ce1099]|uniref:PIN domain-containing protein n=1 Tax=Sorangium sp. So ce1099 TaxID=3133331 RepID=UPI003F5D9FB1
MVAFDTNVVVRLLLRDNAAQAKKAEQAFLRHARGDGVFLPLVVLVETVWVLAYTYELDRKAIHEHLLSLVRTRGVVVDEADLVQEALDAYAKGSADFADYVILATTRREGCRALLTFDRRLGKERGANAL